LWAWDPLGRPPRGPRGAEALLLRLIAVPRA